MPKINIPLPCKPHENQLAMVNATARFNVFACGRRFGKTEAAKIRCQYRAPKMRVWYVMPTFESGQEIWRFFAESFRTFPNVYINNSERFIQFPTGGKLWVKSADSALRTAGIDHIAIDEAAFINNEFWPYVIRPMLLDNEHSSADILSSTNGRNWFWQCYQLGLDPKEPDWASWHYTSYDNPLLSRKDIEDIRRNTPERVFSQEYLAEFLDDGGAVFRNLKACIIAEPQRSQRGLVFGVDLGRSNDYTVITVLDMGTNQVIDIDRFSETGWELQRARMLAMWQKYKPETILIEENFNDSFAERLSSDGLPIQQFRTTAQSKQQIINSLALAFEQASIGIPDNATLLGELQSYTMEKLPSGMFRYTAPSGLHDDMVMSLALAWHALNVPIMQAVSMPDWFFNTDGNW
jgi:hypothetical protein